MDPPRGTAPQPPAGPLAQSAGMTAQAWRGTAIIAAAFTFIVAAVMLVSYQRSIAEDPLNSRQLQLRREQLHKNPNDDALKRQIRAADLAERQRYFTHVRRHKSGAVLLVAGCVVALFASARLLAMRRQPPVPRALAPWKEFERDSRKALLALSTSAGVLFAVIVVLSLNPRAAVKPAGGKATRAAETPATGEWLRSGWSRFRGPDGSGVSAYTNIPAIWNIATRENVAWISPVPMDGNSSPVIVGDQIFLTGAEKNARELFSFSATSGAEKFAALGCGRRFTVAVRIVRPGGRRGCEHRGRPLPALRLPRGRPLLPPALLGEAGGGRRAFPPATAPVRAAVASRQRPVRAGEVHSLRHLRRDREAVGGAAWADVHRAGVQRARRGADAWRVLGRTAESRRGMCGGLSHRGNFICECAAEDLNARPLDACPRGWQVRYSIAFKFNSLKPQSKRSR